MTVTATQTEALEAMLAHHRSLTEGVERRVAALRSAVSAGSGHGPRAADLVAYLAEEVLPHAIAEERTIYLTASKAPDLATTVREMTVEHGRLAELSEQLARTTGDQEALAVATTIAPLFSSHVDKENDVLLPRLLSEGVLADLLGQMHEALEGSEPVRPAITAATDDTALPGVLALLLESVKALSAAGEGDRACRLAASAWAALRGPRPELAVRVTAALHGLVRAVTTEPVKFNGRPGPAPTDDVLDVRQLAPAQRHEVIFETYEHLAPGAAFVLVNDHDPKPLRYQFDAEHAGQVTWEAIEAGPQVWRVRIGRPAVVGAAQ